MFDGFAFPPGVPEPKPIFTPFDGGLDLDTPALSAKPGTLRDCINYELGTEGGYRDIRGYERFDGRAKPSDASFVTLDVTITGTVNVGDTVTGVTTASTGKVIAKTTHVLIPAQTYLVLTRVTGSWNNASENITVAAVVQANTDAVGSFGTADTDLLSAQYKNLAADDYRASILVVAGEGNVWGGFTLSGTKYAIRNKAGGATAAIYKHHATTGWTEVALGRYIAFTSGGTYVLAEGNTMTGATSGATAVVTRFQITSGSFAGGDAAGYIFFASQTGTFQAENINVGANLNVLTIAGNSTALTLSPSGKLDWYASKIADGVHLRVYGADGVNMGWEFDGTVFAFIRTGMTADQPKHVIVHKNKLFFSFGPSVQHSSEGDPFTWSVITGAAEILTNDTVTAFQLQPGQAANAALSICCRQQLYTLYGSDTSDWDLVAYREQVGAFEWTVQTLAQMVFWDDLGLTDLATSQAFGNFQHSSLSKKIQSYVKTFGGTMTSPTYTCSGVVRSKNQYRLFANGRSGLYVTMSGSKVKGIMKVFLSHVATCMWWAEDADGNEELFFGANDGYVYQMEKGTSFDGDAIYAYLDTHVDHGGSMETTKEFFGPVTFEGKGEVQADTYAEISLTYKLDYGRSTVNQPAAQTIVISPNYGGTREPGVGDLRGIGRNVRWFIEKSSDYMEPLLLSGVHYRQTPTVPMRG